jgi:hypothetical protein
MPLPDFSDEVGDVRMRISCTQARSLFLIGCREKRPSLENLKSSGPRIDTDDVSPVFMTG